MNIMVDVLNEKVFGLLADLEELQLIRLPHRDNYLRPIPAAKVVKPADYISPEEAIERLRGCALNDPGTVDDFLADCRKDKEREFAIEQRQEEESRYYARKRTGAVNFVDSPISKSFNFLRCTP